MGPGYVLKADIASYFPSVNHDILLATIRRTIRCKDTLWLIEQIVRLCGPGLPIGALTSQLFANVYLDPLDHFLKDELGVRFYVRYMDDLVFLDPDKGRLREIWGAMEEFLGRLSLRLNPKTCIFPTHHGVDFCGYRVWPTHIRLRKRNVKRAKRRFRKFSRLWKEGLISLEKVRASVMSFLGYAKHAQDYRTTCSVLACLCL